MRRRYYRDLPKSTDLKLVKRELVGGCRVVITAEGGRRLAGKTGIVLGVGATASQIKVLLDGAKSFTVLHSRYLQLLEPSAAKESSVLPLDLSQP